MARSRSCDAAFTPATLRLSVRAMTKRIAMWSGPRNLSTAMMYSFAARGDCRVVDEPFYAAYLAETGLDHPMRDAILASQPNDPKAVADTLTSPLSEPIFYQKHMTHHMLDGWPNEWMDEVQHIFLIRHPARVVASYARKREAPTLADIGFAQQARIFAEENASTGFDGAEPELPKLEPDYARLADAAMPHYEALAAYKIT